MLYIYTFIFVNNNLINFLINHVVYTCFLSGDPHASEITMPDEDRINLMVLVKEGRITMNEALEIVSNNFYYEGWGELWTDHGHRQDQTKAST